MLSSFCVFLPLLAQASLLSWDQYLNHAPPRVSLSEVDIPEQVFHIPDKGAKFSRVELYSTRREIRFTTSWPESKSFSLNFSELRMNSIVPTALYADKENLYWIAGHDQASAETVFLGLEAWWLGKTPLFFFWPLYRGVDCGDISDLNRLPHYQDTLLAFDSTRARLLGFEIPTGMFTVMADAEQFPVLRRVAHFDPFGFREYPQLYFRKDPYSGCELWMHPRYYLVDRNLDKRLEFGIAK